MAQFNIGGQFLDLPADFRIQFQKKNILFSFGDIEVERSTSFNVPATQKNISIFNYAQDFHARGIFMRESYEAQYQDGLVVRNGYLHVTSYSDREFECVFIFGELLGLKDIKNLGSIRQFIPDDIVASLSGYSYSADEDDVPVFAKVAYNTDTTEGQPFMPSWSFGDVMDIVLENAGVNFDWDNVRQELRDKRVVIPRDYNVAPLTSVMIGRRYIGQPSNSQPYPTIGEMTSSSNLFSVVRSDDPIFIVWDEEATDFRRGYVDELRCGQSLNITFPPNTPNNIYLGYASGGSWRLLEGNSFGDIQGLAGRTVKMNSGQRFFFIVREDVVVSGGTPYDGSWVAQGFNYTINVSVEGVKGESDIVRLVDNIPDITIIDMLQVAAALTGSVLDFTVLGPSFNRLGDSWYAVRELKDVIKWSKMTRSFGDFAQNNYIDFDSAKYVTNKVNVNYYVENSSLKESKTLQIIPFSESKEDLSIPVDSDVNTIAQAGDFWLLRRIELPENPTIANLVDRSTSISVEASMTLLDFENIRSNTALHWDGALWVWTEASWNNSVATLSLSRLS